MRFQADDIVRISKKSQYYDADWEEDGDHDRSNPCDEMEGKITETHSDGENPIWVRWNNNFNNVYQENDLRLVRRL